MEIMKKQFVKFVVEQYQKVGAGRQALLCAVLAVVMCPWAVAAVVDDSRFTADSDPIQLEFDAAFQAMLENPADLETVLRYSQAASKAGDFESAVGAMERLLLINSNMPVVRADLGMLYYRLESYQMAEHHLKIAMQQEDKLPPKVRDIASRVLKRIDKKASRHAFSGSISVGLRYQSNANSGPESSTVLSAGDDVLLDEDFQEDEDYSFIGAVRARHEYDLRTQNSAMFDTNATLYSSWYGENESLRARIYEVEPGIRFKPMPNRVKGLSLRPHLVQYAYEREGERRLHSSGAGIDARFLHAPDLTFSGSLQLRDRNFNETDERPNANERDGDEIILRLSAFKGLTENTNLLIQFDTIDQEARVAYRENIQYELKGRINTAYKPLFGDKDKTWYYHFGLSYRNTDFDVPDPVIDPDHSRNDDRWQVSVGTTMVLTRDWLIRLALSQTEVDSNIKNYDQSNTQLDANAVWRF